jgi:hypothetical protein
LNSEIFHPKKKIMKQRYALFTAYLTFFLHATSFYAQFSAGYIVALQVGTGVGSLTNTGNAIILKEFSPTGSPGYTLAIPNSTTNPLIIGGTAISEGALSRSYDKKKLVFAGYSQSLPNSVNLSGSTASNINRAVGAVDIGGSFSRTIHPTFFSSNNVRGATSDGMGNYWASGSNNGTNYFGTVFAALTIQNSITNTRVIHIFNNDLYISSGSGTSGIYKVGIGLPVTSGQSTSLIIGTGSSGPSESPFAFYFNEAMNICYIADDRSVSNGGGIQKWVYSINTWILMYTLSTGTSGARAVIADFNGSNPSLYATTTENNSNKLIKIVDVGANSTASTIATAPANTIFRGVSFSPCETPTLTITAVNGTLCANETLSLNITAIGGSGYSYLWNGSGVFNSQTLPNPLINAPVSSSYSVEVSNSCGSATAAIQISVTALPQLSIISSDSSICFGQTLSLWASGANAYSWSHGQLNGQPFTPTTASTYTLTGSANGCSATQTISVPVYSPPIVSVSSISICPGLSGSLTAAGANTYTWNTGSNSQFITVSPTVNTVFTVSGSSQQGCVGSASAQVVMSQTPTISVNSKTICSGNSATLIAQGVDSYTWSNSANTNSIVVNPLSPVVYTVSGELTGCTATGINTATVHVNQLPVISMSGNTPVCIGSTINITAFGAQSYTWSLASGSTLTGSFVSIVPTQSSSYTITGTDINGCSSVVTNTLIVELYPLIKVTPDEPLICLGESVILHVSGAQSYLWNNGDTTSSIVVTPDSNTLFKVTGMSFLKCASTVTINVLVDLCENLKETEKIKLMELYPVPATQHIILKYTSPGKVDLKIIDNLGRIVLLVKDIENNSTIDISPLEKGKYTVHLNNQFITLRQSLLIN